MESLQLYYSVVCVFVLAIVFYFYWKRFRLLQALVFSVGLLTLAMSHLFHIIWGEGFVYKLCDADEDEMFAWTDCIGSGFSEVFLNSYEITVFLQVAILRSVVIWFSSLERDKTLSFKERVWWLYFIIFNTIAICLAVLLWMLPGSILTDYVVVYNVLAFLLSLFLIVFFSYVPKKSEPEKLEEETPLNKIEGLSDSEI